MRPDPTFRRNFFVIGGLHIVAVVIVYFASGWHHKSHADKAMWLDGGSIGGGGAQAGEPAPEPPASSEPEPKPAPRSKSEPPPPPLSYPAPGELVLSRTTPKPSTAKPTPRHFTPKPTPKHTPKPRLATPKPEPAEVGDNSTPKPKASPSEKPAGTPDTAKTESTTGAIKTSSASRTPGASPGNTPGAGTGTGNASSSGNAAGVGSGNGKGTAKSGSGSGTSEFGWYFSMIHDRFHSRWDQPSSLARGTQDIITTLKIRIGKDGSILSRDIVHSSGDTTMDESVMTAAERVQQIDPLPAGLGNGESYEINIAFKLDQSQ